MSKERELLERLLVSGIFESGLYEDWEQYIKELLTQPEQDLQEDIREGITLRDHFACAAMQGLLVSMKFKSGDLCLTAYSFADLMLAEGEKEHD